MKSDYRLIDWGDGRRLEEFGGVRCDRPAPMATRPRQAPPAVWAEATLRFDAAAKRWAGAPPGNWQFRARVGDLPEVRLGLAPGANGQIGVFPEQLDNWAWLARTIAAAPERGTVKVLNAFAHTGAATLFCAAAGAAVCHLDAAAGAVAQARKNAALSGLAERPVRWIVDDALKFLRREARRESFYDGVILDPPAFGRNGKTVWRLADDLDELLALAAQLLTPRPLFALVTCHPTGWGPEDLRAAVSRHFPMFAETRAQEIRIAGQYGDLPLGLCWRGSTTNA